MSERNFQTCPKWVEPKTASKRMKLDRGYLDDSIKLVFLTVWPLGPNTESANGTANVSFMANQTSSLTADKTRNNTHQETP